MTHNVSTSFIGGGVMGEAMVKSLLRSGAPAGVLSVAEPNIERRTVFEAMGVRFFSRNLDAAREAEVIVLSIKPQTMHVVLGELARKIKPDALVLSIMAGVPISKIALALGDEQPIVRVMPNTPAQIGEGISGWTCTPNVSQAQRAHAESILASMGEHIFFEDEHYLDMVTALSGTGPAYVFMFMEAMIDAGVHLGFPRHVAETLVLHTIKGSADFALQSKLHPAQLRNQVTSPGGTTAAALYQLEKGGLRTVLSRAIWAAYERSVQLGKG